MPDQRLDSPPSLSLRSLIVAGVRFHWRTSMAVAWGVAVATSVIVGALLVGDSMRGSLRALTIERLGRIESIVAPGGFFSAGGAAATLGVPADQLAAVILFDRAVIETVGDGPKRRSGAVQAIGCDASFWDFDLSGVAPDTLPGDDSVVVTQTLADELGVKIGDRVTVRLPVEQAVPADSPLGRRDVETEGIPRLEVVDILPDRGLARFSLSPAQATPKNVFLARELVADVLERAGQANVALSSTEISDDAMNVSLADLGLSLERITKRFDDETIFDYYSLTSDRLLVDQTAVDVITDSLPEASVTPTMTYLANAIERVGENADEYPAVVYSTITAIDPTEELPLDFSMPQSLSDAALDDASSGDTPREDAVPMVLNSWAADRLQAQVGTRLTVAYFEPEVDNGKEVERHFDAVVTSVVPITQPARRYIRDREAVFDQAPTVYNDPNLTPAVPGVTDQDTIESWGVPFEMTRKVDTEDDEYWRYYRLTPKAFIPLADGQRLFASRFGKTTSLRIDVSVAEDRGQLQDRLVRATGGVLPQLGWQARSLRADQLSASKGTTPFDGLFLSLSFFVIFAAVMLIAMLFRLGLVSRSKQLGALMALGWERRRVARVFLGEGMVIAVLGVLLGVVGGVLYAMFVLYALRTFWVGAVTVPFLRFHAGPASLIGGGLIGLVIGFATLWWTLRSMLKNETVTLLRGQDSSDQIVHSGTRAAWPVRVAAVLFLAAIGTGVIGAMSGGQTAAGSFVSGGMLLLVAMLLIVYQWLRGFGRRHSSDGSDDQSIGYSLPRLAQSNSARSPLRSTLTIGLMATASFLIVAITAFRLQPSAEGTGGFDLVAELAQPLYEDLTDANTRKGLLGSDAGLLDGASVVTFRVRGGQDASCNNLYQATEPTVFGVPRRSFEDLGRFRFYAAGELPAGDMAAEYDTPWSLLDVVASGTEEDPIPMIVDQNTAMWSLKMIRGVGEVKAFTYDNSTLYFKVVGLLENSLLQGRLMIGEENFEQAFPSISGYRFVLIDGDDQKASAIADALETRLGDVGFDGADTAEVLSGMMAVQNTYLRTFQSLGGLGLLLGTVGLAIAQLRNVLERRSELAVMRAIGFTQHRLAAMVMGETATLLLIGIGCGVFCAAVAVLPHALTRSATPPIVEPILLVVGIILFGLIAGLVAASRVVRMRLLDSLRGS